MKKCTTATLVKGLKKNEPEPAGCSLVIFTIKGTNVLIIKVESDLTVNTMQTCKIESMCRVSSHTLMYLFNVKIKAKNTH